MNLLKSLTTAAAIAAFLTAGGPSSHAAGLGERPPRYTPEGTDFIITNGKSFFNRPLYGGNTGFRAEAGDKPEFAFYLPGRGGNLRLGLMPATGQGGLWLFDAKSVIARYRPGSMVYEIREPLLGGAALTLTAIPMAGTEGLVLRASLAGAAPALRLVWAFGGANGEPGRRNGDLNAEREPLDRFFQLKPDFCKGNAYSLRPDGFTLTCKSGTLAGLTPPGAKSAVADATKWATPGGLLASANPAAAFPVVTGEIALTNRAPLYLAIHRVRKGLPAAPDSKDLPRVFEQAEKHRRDLAEHVLVETPDPFINVAASALNVAADAIWDEAKGIYMHGAVGWRVPLLGWRGPYAGDALGWPERTRRHIEGFVAQQITTPPPAKLPPADEKYNLARSETALNSNGNFIGGFIPFYDMNTVAVDAMFRHLMWTGDRELAARFWPVLERHLAWQRRLFRRPVPDDSSPLYEAYAAIWASDQLMYSGGGATHSSSYNYWHNRMAARLAKLLDKDPAPYDREADAIAKTMRRELWLGDRGWFAEYKDFLGLKLQHPSAAAWTFYHTLDSDAASPMEAWQMSRFIDTRLAKIPMRVKGVAEPCFQLPTTNWHPYMWSINNVALAESAHTALGLWQTGRTDMAFPLLKGALLESMFLGACPGNVGMTTPSDVFSGERYRDFADGAGITARAIVEGLFGLQPDQLAGEIRVRPGFPKSWDKATLRHPDLTFSFKREGLRDSYVVDSKLPKPMALRLQIAAPRDHVAAVTIDGKPAEWRAMADAAGAPRVEIVAPPAARRQIVIEWQGDMPATLSTPPVIAMGARFTAATGPAKPLEISDPQGFLKHVSLENGGLNAVADGTLGHRTAFVKVSQGDLVWWSPLTTELRPPFEILASPDQDATHLRFRLRNNTTSDLASIRSLRLNGRTLPQAVQAAAGKDSAEISLVADGLPPGSHRIALDLENGGRVEGLVVNWKLDPTRARVKWEPLDLTGYFNDAVTRIFQNDYLSPRSPFCSLAIPKHGIGGWCQFDPKVEINDAGLRAAAGMEGGIFRSLLGVPFKTPGTGDAKNILFTSQWDNYPREASVPLTGRASRACLLMAGSTNPMQSQFDNGEVVVTYADGSPETLILRNPTTWWPIDQDYFIDSLAFTRPEPAPPRLDLKTGKLRVMETADFKSRTLNIPGGAATVLDLPLDPHKELRSITVRTLANDVVIGLMSLSLAREAP